MHYGNMDGRPVWFFGPAINKLTFACLASCACLTAIFFQCIFIQFTILYYFHSSNPIMFCLSLRFCTLFCKSTSLNTFFTVPRYFLRILFPQICLSQTKTNFDLNNIKFVVVYKNSRWFTSNLILFTPHFF